MTYDRECVVLASNKPFLQSHDVDGKRITMILKHQPADDYKTVIRQKIFDRHRCNTCSARMKYFTRYSNGEVPLFVHSLTDLCKTCPLDVDTKQFYIDLIKYGQKICKMPILGMKILTGDHVDGHKERLGGFSHYFMRIDQSTEVSPLQAALYEKAFMRYLPSILPTMLDNMFPKEKETVQSRIEKINAMKKSLGIVAACLPEVTYGHILEPSVKWMQRVVEFYENVGFLPHERSRAQQWIDGAEMILWTKISPDDRHNAVSPVIQQAKNNLMDAMNVAYNREGLISLLTDRLRPDKYQRPSTTKPLSMGSIMNAVHILGSFENKIMSHDEAAALPHAIRLSSSNDSMTGFKAMLAANKKPSVADFGSRCDVTDINTITSLTALLNYVVRHPTTRLQIRTSNLNPIYVAKTTLHPDMLSVPHFWAFMNGKKPSIYGMKDYEDVRVIVPLFKYTTYKSILFIVDHVELPKNMSGTNCCFPEFLSVQHRRTCRDAFERLNTTVPIGVSHPPAFGVGVSCTNTFGDLNRPITLYINSSHSITIRKL